MQLPEKKIYSFDVFDTALVRHYCEPWHLFWQCADELNKVYKIDINNKNWVSTRQKAEQVVRNHSKKEEITLDLIYEYLLKNNYSTTILSLLKSLELDLELKCLHQNQEIKEIIDNLRNKNKKIIFISDMYLPKSLIYTALFNADLLNSEDDIFVSSEIGFTKATGNLYDYVSDNIKIPRSDWVHIGDNFQSDYLIPKIKGIHSILYKESQKNRFEKKLLVTLSDLVIENIAYAGISRICRLNFFSNSIQEKVIHDISANIIGPLLLNYTLWVLENAKQNKINKLYFLARDGQILCWIAKYVVEKLSLDIEIHYLYASRQSLHLPAIISMSDFHVMDWLFEKSESNTVKTILARLNMTPETMKEELNEAGFIDSVFDKELNSNQIDSLKKTILSEKSFNKIKPIITEYRNNLLGYLKQEGFLDSSSKIGIVDIGWKGRLQYSLSSLLDATNNYGINGLSGFYFGLNVNSKLYKHDKHFVYHPNSPRFISKNHGQVLEIFVQADHGTTLYYRKENEFFMPVLKEEINSKAVQWGLRIQQNAVKSFVSSYFTFFKSVGVTESNRILMTNLLDLFLITPKRNEASVYGNLDFYDDQNETISKGIVQKIGYSNYLELFIPNKFRRSNLRTLWIEGCIVYSNLKGKKLLILLLSIKSYFISLKGKKINLK